MNPIKNPETEQFCQQVASLYQTDKDGANKMFVDFINKEKGLMYWEQLAIKERTTNIIRVRISDIIHKENK